MKRRAVWRAGLAVLVAMAGMGCGSPASSPGSGHPPEDAQPSASAPPSTSPAPTDPPASAPVAAESPAEGARSTPAATAPAEAPPTSDGRQVTPEPTPITFEVPACVPVSPPAGTRHAHPCSVKRFGTDGLPLDLQYLDAQGRDTGLFQYAQGALSFGYRLTYDALGRPQHKDFYSGTRTTPDSSIDWLYDAAGRLVLVEGDGISGEYHADHDFNGSHITVRMAGHYQERHLYDAQGRLTRVEHFDSPQFISRWENYFYNSQGLLQEIGYASEYYCGGGPRDLQPRCGIYSSQTFTYHPGGQLKHDRLDEIQNYDCTWDAEYDEQGRLVSTGDSLTESGALWTWTYDARGQRVQEHFSVSSSLGTSERWTSWLYDDAGQPGASRFTSDWTPWQPEQGTTHQTWITRSFHACGSGDLLFEEQDTNEDGVRDGWHELTRDGAGNLQVETYHGSLVQEVYLSRIEYDYSCYP